MMKSQSHNINVQGTENMAVEEMRVRESHGKDVNIALKNNIEAIILKWSYQARLSTAINQNVV